jgi:RNA polymerase sigma-70 factor (ECF subfamily)
LASLVRSIEWHEPLQGGSGEAALVVAARDGDREAFGILYSRYARMVHGIVLANSVHHDVDDVVQDVFVTALDRLASLRDAGAFGPWLTSIARNRALDHHRAKRETVELSSELPAPATLGADGALILAAIRSLPDTYRETLTMRLVDGMSGPEIAVRTGLQPDSVRVNLHRGMKLLREKLKGSASDE